MLLSNMCALVKVCCYIREVAHVAVILYARLHFSEIHLFIFQPFWFSLHCYSLSICIIPDSEAQLNPLIKSANVSSSTLLCFPLSRSPRLECACIHVYACVFAYVCICVHPYHIIGLDIKASYLQRVSWRQPKEYLISLPFADYLPFGIHWAEREATPWPSKLHLICFSHVYTGNSSMTLSILSVSNRNSLLKWQLILCQVLLMLFSIFFLSRPDLWSLISTI